MVDIAQTAGVLLVDKPSTWTSHDVVNFVRRFGFKKVGHCGTLDPAATGLLVLVFGRATKLSERFAGQDKTYTGVARLGITTDSHDADGKVIEERDCAAITADDVAAVIDRYQGELSQIPPMVSAKKVGGKKLYELARRGEEIEREPRPIVIHELSIDKMDLPSFAFTVHCSKGTYVRTLVHDIGHDLGCGAHLSGLRRTASGRYDVKDAYAMDEIKTWTRDSLATKLIPLETALTYI